VAPTSELKVMSPPPATNVKSPEPSTAPEKVIFLSDPDVSIVGLPDRATGPAIETF